MQNIPKLFAPPPALYSSRREFLTRVGGGFGMIALAGMLQQEQARADWSPPDPTRPMAPRPGHYPAKAKNVIWLFINGGPSHVDTWDYKPELQRRDGQEIPNFDRNTGFFRDQVGPIMKSPFRFQRHGKCGKYVSEIFRNLARHVD